MKIKDAINMANLMEQGNVLPKELAILFLSELDGMIQSDIMLHAPEEIVSYDNEEQELLLRPPHDKLYVHYLVMMIRNQQQEYEGYQNTQAAVDEKLKTFGRWYVQHYRPADTDSRSYMGGTSADAFGFAYLTAYGLAVRNGYQGTEEQWLESLRGAPGDPGAPARMRYDEAREMIQWGVGEVWYDLFDLQTMRDPVVAEFLREVENTASAAGQSAIAAGNSEAAARGHAKTAADAAADALTLAGQVNSACQQAKKYAFEAGQSAQSAAAEREAAENAAIDAQTQAQTAGNHAKAAEESAKRAEAATGNAGGGSAGDINDAIEGHNTDLAAHLNMQENLNALRDRAISEAIGSHNTDLAAHNDLRLVVQQLQAAVNSFLDVDDATRDELSEVLALIDANADVIEAITASKVSVADIVNNLVSNVANKPLSAAMGVALAGEIDSVRSALAGYQPKGEYLLATALGAAIDTALAEAQASGQFDGADGRGIKSIVRTVGNGAAGTVDTYTITYTDGTTSTFNVRNGDNGKNGTDGKDGIDGADGQPGSDGITPHIGSNGNWYIGTTDTGIKAQGPKGDDGADGKTPIKGSDYWTPADQEAIVQQVIAALGTPVFGRVDGENNIILTGELADGTYTLKYEDGEGNVTEIGTMSTGVEELITENIPIAWEVGLKLGKNDNNHTTVSVVEGTANSNAYAASQHIEYNPEASYTIAMSATGYRKISVCCYDEAGDNIGYLDSIIGENGANTGPASIQFTPVSGTKTFRFRLWFGYNGAPISNWISVISLSKTYVG